MKDLGIVSKRIPAWLLSDADIEAAGLSSDRRNSLRPDIMLIESAHEEQMTCTIAQELPTKVNYYNYHVPKALQPKIPKGTRPPPQESRTLPRPRIIWLLEGGYTSDTRYEEKF